MPNNILITPGSASIEFSGSAANNLKLQVLSNGNVAITGSIGKVAEFSNTGQVFITSSMQARQFTGSFGIVAFVGTASRVTDGAYLSEAQTFSALKTFSAGIDLANADITGVNNITINDPGPGEGISWAGGNLWKIYESPNNLTTNSGGNLHIVENATRRATFNTSGQLEIPIATGTAPFVVSSTTLVTNLNADLLDGYNTATSNTADTVVVRDGSGNFSAGTITAYLSGYADAVDSNDTRATNDTPASRNSGVYFDFKQNSTNGLSDGGTYNGQMTWRSYGSGTDLSGGQPIQIAYTANSRIWTRIGTGTTTWASWRQLLDSVSQVYAYNMDQNVRTTDVVTFSGVYTTNVGINDSGFDVYINFSDANPTYYGNAYGGVFTFYGDKSIDAAFLDFGGAQVRRTLQAGSSLRAPIFYDSDSTAYYADFHSTGTSINIQGSLRAATYNKPAILSVASGTSSTGGSLAIQQETTEGWTGVFVDFEPYTGWGLWHDNPNNYFSFTAEASTGQIRSFTVPSRVSGNRTAYEKFRIDQNNGDVIIGRDGYAQSSLRAPIFYDQPNTSYYVDPASTSNLNVLNVGGWAVQQFLDINVSAGNWYTIATNPGNRAFATFHTWDYNSGLHHHQKFNAGVHFGSVGGTTLTLLGKSWYSGGGVAGNIRIRGTGTYDTHYLQVYANYTGTLRIAMTDNFQSSGWTLVNGGTGSPGASTFAEIDPNAYRGFATNAPIYSGASVYAPIFYDANDANFYLDPNGTTLIRYLKMLTGGTSSATRALTIRAEGQGEINFGSYPASWTSALQIQNNNNTDFIWISPLDDGYNARFRTGGSGLDFYTDGGNDGGTYSGFIGSGYIQGINSIRGPIFYDSNDTGYYYDPHSTSQSAGRQRGGTLYGPNPTWGAYLYVGTDGRQGLVDSGTPSVASTNGNLHMDAGSGYQMYLNYYDGTAIYFGGGAYNNWGEFSGGIFYAYNQMRSPIMYDYNNTGYYSDPNGSSRLNGIYVNGGDSYGAFYFYSNLGGYAGSLSGPGLQVYSSGNNSAFMSFHKGGYYAVNMGLDADNVLRIGGWSASASRWQLDMSGNNWVASSFRAPIFYDSDDTGGYLDPRTPSNGLRFYSAAGWWQLRGATHWDSQPGIDLSGGTSEFRISSTGGNANLRVDGWMFAYDSSYFPFIYDTYDTGYYLDPNSVSQLNYVLANNWFRPQGCTGVYWQSYGRGIWSPECEGNPYGHIATYGGGRNGWYGYGMGWRWTLMTTVGDNIGVHDASRGNWLWYWDGGYTRWNFGYNYFAGDVRSWRFYDHDTGYYGDFNSETNWQGLTTRGKAQIGLTGRTNWKRPDITGDGGYWTGVMGWGSYDMYSIMDWGSGFFDTWGGSNYPPGTSHYLGIQSFHYSAGYNYAYGWQLVGGPIGGAWWKNSWPYSGPWRKIAMYELNEYSYSFWSTIMYDANNGGYYIDPDGGSRLNVIYPNEIYNYGWFRNQNSGQGMYNQSSAMHWYSNNGYWKAAGGGYSYGGTVYYRNYESDIRGYCYWDGNGFGLLSGGGSWAVNVHPSTYQRVTIAGGPFWNAYNSTSGARLMFSGGDEDAAGNYYIGNNFDNYNGNYNKLELRWHTGIRIGAQTYYGGIRMYNTEDMDSLILQVGGSSEYLFKYRWMYTTEAGFYSGYNGAHWYPNYGSSYGAWRSDGQRNGWYGFSIGTGNNPHLMFDGSGNGGVYVQDYGRWVFYHSLGNNCIGIGTSYTQNNFGIWIDRPIAALMLNLSNYNKDSYTKPGAIAIGRTDYNYDSYWQNPNAAGIQTHCADTFEWALHDSGAAWWSAFWYQSYGYMVIGRNIGWGANSVWAGGAFYNGWSDERLKTDITVIDAPIEKLKQLKGVYYRPSDLAKIIALEVGDMNARRVGVLAQDVEKVLPEIINLAAFDLGAADENGNPTSKTGDRYLTVEYSKIIPLLIEAIKEQQNMIEELQTRLNNM